MAAKKYRILVVDDSLLLRNVLTDVLNASPLFEVVDSASNGKIAVEKVKQLKPDGVTLDVEMPIMDGIDALRQIMAECPTPVLMVSSITYEGGFKTLQALEAGAFDYIQKPKAQFSSSLKQVGDDIAKKLLKAIESQYIAKFKANFAKSKTAASPSKASAAPQDLGKMPIKLAALTSRRDLMIAVGISTGGPPCVSKIFESMPENSPPILVVQHMPEGFTKAMAERINSVSAMKVKEAEDGDLIQNGCGFIAPGHSHIEIVNSMQGNRIRLSKKGLVSGHQPSADVLFESAAAYGKKVVGVIMTGMGRDGASGLKKLHATGAHTIAQDEASCVVFGMPKMAIAEGGVDEILSLSQIVSRLKQIASIKM